MAVTEAAPSPVLRAALNLNNTALVRKTKDRHAGLAPDLARQIAAATGRRLRFLDYPSAHAVVEDAERGRCRCFRVGGADPIQQTPLDGDVVVVVQHVVGVVALRHREGLVVVGFAQGHGRHETDAGSVFPAQDSGAGRGAELRGVGLAERSTFLHQPVQVGRFVEGAVGGDAGEMPGVAFGIHDAEVVGQDKNDVRNRLISGSRWRFLGAAAGCKQKDPGAKKKQAIVHALKLTPAPAFAHPVPYRTTPKPGQ